MSHLSHREHLKQLENKRNPFQRFLDDDDVAARDAALEAAMQQREQEKPVYQPEHEE